jgi:hypothetical protein
MLQSFILQYNSIIEVRSRKLEANEDLHREAKFCHLLISEMNQDTENYFGSSIYFCKIDHLAKLKEN